MSSPTRLVPLLPEFLGNTQIESSALSYSAFWPLQIQNLLTKLWIIQFVGFFAWGIGPSQSNYRHSTKQIRNKHGLTTYMHRMEFEPMIPEFERSKKKHFIENVNSTLFKPYNDKAIPVTGRGGQQGRETLRLSRQSAHRRRWGCQPYAPAALYPQEDSWYSFLLEAESTPGPQCGWKD
jgi:hypothetical protein